MSFGLQVRDVWPFPTLGPFWNALGITAASRLWVTEGAETIHKAATAAAAFAFASALGAGASPAPGEPEMVLPDATLFCGMDVVRPPDGAMHNGATMWIAGDDSTGHYVILSFARHGLEGALSIVGPITISTAPG